MMSNNLETFIKYLDGELSIIDTKAFEEELNINTKLKDEFESFSRLYSSNKNNISIDERYFATLLPNAKKKILKPIPIWKNKYALSLPILLTVLFFMFGLPVKKLEYEKNIILIEFASTDDEIANDIINSSPNYFTDDQIFSEFYDEDLLLDASVFDYLEQNINIAEINDELVDSFSESEFIIIYEQIFDKNIVGK